MLIFEEKFSVKKTKDIDLLQERIKELYCLYAVSSIASQRGKSYSEIVQEIVNRIPQAWFFPEAAMCVLRIENEFWTSHDKIGETVSLIQTIFIEDIPVGTLSIHYPSDTYQKEDFLEEELALLKKLAVEIAHVLDQKNRTEREEAFLLNAQRQDRLTILGEITAGIAHELNTPLGNILGFAQLIMESNVSEQSTADATKIMHSAIYAREIVKKLMFFSCELPQQFELVEIHKLIQDAIQLLGPSIQKSGVNIEMKPHSKEIFAQVDTIQITQVVFNLLLNAIYASPENSCITVSILQRDKNVGMLFADQGGGIPLELQERIFEPFFTTKPTGEGSGLGLSVVHGIVKAHHGSIQVASSELHGTTFYIEIPLIQPS
jgi:signal transduction histidine kinase